MSKKTDKICAALAGLNSAITRAEIVERSGLSSHDVGGSLHYMVQTGAITRHAGATKRTTGYALSPEYAEKLDLKKKPRREEKTRARKTPRAAGKARTLRDLAQKHLDVNGDVTALAARHIATTLATLEAVIVAMINRSAPIVGINDPFDMDGADSQVTSAFSAHKEAIEIAQRLAV